MTPVTRKRTPENLKINIRIVDNSSDEWPVEGSVVVKSKNNSKNLSNVPAFPLAGRKKQPIRMYPIYSERNTKLSVKRQRKLG